MTAWPTTRPTAASRVRDLARAGVVMTALALAASPFAQPAIARADYDPDYFTFCRENTGQSVDYCCAQAGGVVTSGACGEPVSQAPPLTITQRPRAPIIVVPQP
jgi:hypothetical protein